MNSEKLTSKCPICDSSKQNDLLDLKTCVVDKSPLYENIIIKVCVACGHIFNELTQKDLKGLYEYYNDEYSLTNLSSQDTISDRPGSSNKNTVLRFEQLFNISKDLIDNNSSVLDIGCAKGGFLKYLYSKGIKNLCGIDFSKDFISYSKVNKFYETKLGYADDIPFEDNKFDIIYMDQVLEHLHNPRKAFHEVKRVLKEGGYFCIGVPNSLEYLNSFIFDFFWFLMKEHIQHFDIYHLILLASREGFEFEKSSFDNNPMMSGNVYLPNINIVFKYTSKKNNFNNLDDKLFILEKTTRKYLNIEASRLEVKKKLISRIINKKERIYFWGIGREFLYLLANTNLDINDIYILIDGNEYKRKNLKVKGMNILEPNILKESTHDSILIITAAAYKDRLKKLAVELGFLGTIIEI